MGATIRPKHRFGTCQGDGALAIGLTRLVASTHQAEKFLTVRDWLNEHEMGQTWGHPYHPMAQGKIERCHESLINLMPEDVYYGRGQAILNQRRRIKQRTLTERPRLYYKRKAALR